MLQFRRISLLRLVLCWCVLAGVFAWQASPVEVARAATECAPTIGYGDTLLCTLATSGEIDQFTFGGTTGDEIVLQVGTGVAAIDPQVRVLNSSAATICQTSGFGNTVWLETCSLPTTDTYTILVNDSTGGDTGVYGLSLQRRTVPAGGIALSFGTPQATSISAPGEIDAYTFSLAANDVLLVRGVSTTSGFKLYLRVFDGTGALRCGAVSFSAITDLSTCPPLPAGNYTLMVGSYVDSPTGTYGLAIERPNNPAAAVTLDAGVPRSATLAAAGELDTYTFAAQAQDSVLVRVGRGSGGIKPQIWLYDRSGVLVCQATSFTEVTELGPCLLPTTGTYVLVVGAFETVNTGSYGVMLQKVNRAEVAPELTVGSTIVTDLTTAGQFASFTLTADASDVFYLRLGSNISNLDPYLRVYGNDGALICSAFSFGAVADAAPCLVPRAGRYTVLASSINTATTGDYGLSVQRINRPESARPLYFGRTRNGSLTMTASIQSFTFLAQAGSTVLVRMVSAIEAVDPYIQVFTREGTRICSAFSFARATEISRCVLPTDGEYTVIATSVGGGSGAFTLGLACVSATCGGVAAPREQRYVPWLVR